MDDHLEMDYEDRNGDPELLADTISYPYYGDDEDDTDEEYDDYIEDERLYPGEYSN